MYVFYYIFYGPAIQVAVLKGKGDTAIFYRDKALKKNLKNSEYDQEIPQSQTTDKPITS